jgi:hypothetical protein
MKFDRETGKRLKKAGSISSLQYELKRRAIIAGDFQTDIEVFFGEHLLAQNPASPIGIVESEKTAVIASICSNVFPSMIWLATGSKQWLKPHRLERIGLNRTIVLYPDADGYSKWAEIALEGRKLGLSIKVSSLIEKCATEAEKADGADLADYLIEERRRQVIPF